MLEETRHHINCGRGGWRRRVLGGGHDFLQSIERIHYHSLVSLYLA